MAKNSNDLTYNTAIFSASVNSYAQQGWLTIRLGTSVPHKNKNTIGIFKEYTELLYPKYVETFEEIGIILDISTHKAADFCKPENTIVVKWISK